MSKKYKIPKPFRGFGQDTDYQSHNDLIKQGYQSHYGEYTPEETSITTKLIGLNAKNVLGALIRLDETGGVPESLDAKCLELIGYKFREWVNYEWELFWRALAYERGLIKEPAEYVVQYQMDDVIMSFTEEEHEKFLEFLESKSKDKNHFVLMDYLVDRGYLEKPNIQDIKNILGEQ